MSVIRVVILILVLSPSNAMADNFATCILDRMPEAQNKPSAIAILRVCKKKHPGGLEAVKQGSGRGWFGYNSGDECAAKEAAKTPNRRAGVVIYKACRRLYDKPKFNNPWEKDWSKK